MAAECVDARAWREFVPEFQIASLAVLAARRDGLDPSYAIDLVLAAHRPRLRQGGGLARDARGADRGAAHADARGDDRVRHQRPRRARGRPAAAAARAHGTAWTDGNLAELEGYERWCDCVNTAAERASMKRLLDDRNPLLAAAIDTLHAGGRRCSPPSAACT